MLSLARSASLSKVARRLLLSLLPTRIPGFDKLIEHWNLLARNSPQHICNDIIEKILSIISIAASEASCERNIRGAKSSDLVRAIVPVNCQCLCCPGSGAAIEPDCLLT
jgi:hypothetical protein